MRMKVLEALAAGAPVVTTTVGAAGLGVGMTDEQRGEGGTRR